VRLNHDTVQDTDLCVGYWTVLARLTQNLDEVLDANLIVGYML
jgi:hypothetical protein